MQACFLLLRPGVLALFFIFMCFFFPVAPTQEAEVDDLAGFQLSDAEGMPSGFFFQVIFLCNYYFLPPTTWGACPSTEASYNSYFVYFFQSFFSVYPDNVELTPEDRGIFTSGKHRKYRFQGTLRVTSV